jgi:hypothetical protein
MIDELEATDKNEQMDQRERRQAAIAVYLKGN